MQSIFSHILLHSNRKAGSIVFSERIPQTARMLSKNMSPQSRETGHFIEQCAVDTLYRNETRYSLAITTRAGLRVTLPPTECISQSPGSLVVRTQLRYRPQIKTDVDDQYSAGRPIPDRDSEVWRAAIESRVDAGVISPAHYGAARVASVNHYIDQNDIIAQGGSVYIENLDILVTIVDGSGRLPPPHPYSRLGSIARVNEMTSDSFGLSDVAYAVKIVDRQAVFGGRFLNFSGRVVYIPAEDQVDDTIMDGVYLTINKPHRGKKTGHTKVTEYFDFHDVEAAVPLFKSYEEALTLGKPEEVRKREIDREKAELERLRHQQSVEQFEQKRKLAEAEEVFNERQRLHERDMSARREDIERRRADVEEREIHLRQREHELKTEQVIVKNKLESKSDARKAVIEALKFIPAVIGGIIAITVAYNKLSSSK